MKQKEKNVNDAQKIPSLLPEVMGLRLDDRTNSNLIPAINFIPIFEKNVHFLAPVSMELSRPEYVTLLTFTSHVFSFSFSFFFFQSGTFCIN
jgi:hypothetical protein